MKLFFVTLLVLSLFFSCSSSNSAAEKLKDQTEKRLKKFANERLGDSVVYEVIPLYDVTYMNERLMKVYDIIMSMDTVKKVFDKYGNLTDTIFLGIINGESLNDTMVKLPNDTLKMVLEGDSSGQITHYLSINYALTGEPEIRIRN